MGTTLRELIELAGGMSRGKDLKFWTPGGSSTPMLTAEHLDVPLDFDAVGQAGSMLGTTAVMIFDEDDCVYAPYRWTEFYHHESCGKCTPCREGNYWKVGIYERIEPGEGTHEDLDTLLDLSTTSSAGRSARWATVRPARCRRRSSTSAGLPGLRRGSRLPFPGARSLAGAH